MSANLENSAVAMGLEKVSFSFQSQRRAEPKIVQATVQLYAFHTLARLCSKSFKLDFSSMWIETSRCRGWFWKRQRNQRPNCQDSLDHRESKRVPEKHLFLLYWLCQSLWLCGSEETVENSYTDGNTRPPDLPLEKPICRSGSNS